jgi:hypothetical protein
MIDCRALNLARIASVAAALALLAAAPAAAQTAPSVGRPRLAVLPSGSSPSDRCAFPFIVDTENVNLAYPDPNATYWAMPLSLAAGESMLVQGTYPSARFMAVTLYTLAGDTITQLSDLDIAPDPGSSNPFAVAPPLPEPGRSWTIEILPAGGTSSRANVLHLDEGQTAGWIVYRVYLGNPPGDLAGGAPLPTLIRRRGAQVTAKLEPCATQLPGTGIAAVLSAALPEPLLVTAAPEFVRLSNESGLFANEANAYLSAFSDAPPGNILVIRGKVPSEPDTELGESVVGDFAMRYFSITSNLNEKPYPNVDGVYGNQLPRDANGRYTVVIARDADVPDSDEIFTWLRWGDGASQAVIIRNMLPASSFPHAVQDVTPTAYGAPSDARLVMDEYYPEIAACSRVRFELAGADGCFDED